MSIEVPASPKQKDALRAPSAKQAVPTTTAASSWPSVSSRCVLAVPSLPADRVSILPPSLGQWLEIGAALGLSCSANGVLALLVRRHGSVLVLGACGLLLALPFAVPYTYPISASAHALVAFIGAWKAADMLAGTRPQAAVASGDLAYFAHMVSTVEFRTENRARCWWPPHKVSGGGSSPTWPLATPGSPQPRRCGAPLPPSEPRHSSSTPRSGAYTLSSRLPPLATASPPPAFSRRRSSTRRSCGRPPYPILGPTVESAHPWPLPPLRVRRSVAAAAGGVPAPRPCHFGMFHEYAFSPVSQTRGVDRPLPRLFLAQAPVVSFDRWARGQPALRRRGRSARPTSRAPSFDDGARAACAALLAP